jgi:hypothetical protein
MSEPINGDFNLPTIKVLWDPAKQDVQVLANPEDFKSFVFVISLLQMALDDVKEKLRLARVAHQMQQMAQAQNQHQEAVMAEQLRKKLKL